MSKNKASLHVKMYVDEVLSGCLKNAGFTCPDEKSLYWYRLKENDIINVITFYSPWRNLPVMLYSGYGIHSLYHRPMYSTSLSHDTRPLNGLLCCKHPIVENTSYDRMSYRQYSDEILVMVPDILGRGLYTIEGKILPVMDSINTFEECYQLHKQQQL